MLRNLFKQSYSGVCHAASHVANSKAEPYISPGMPKLKSSGKILSLFEFWPLWIMYFPVAIQWLILSIYYRSLSLPLIANPNISTGGMVGYSKSGLLEQASPVAHEALLNWITHTKTKSSLSAQLEQIMEALANNHLSLPIVAKPDLGCRGVGIKLINTESELKDCLSHYPEGSALMLQQLADWEPEAGIFYVRHPGEDQGRIISLALKYTPYVVGDGKSTLRELLQADARAKQVMHLYLERHQDNLNDVIEEGLPFRLIFAASHSRGAIFTNGEQYNTSALTTYVDDVMSSLPEFYYGRLDVKFNNVESLMQGRDIAIIEINGTASESLHIWDKETALTEAWSVLLKQYRTLFRIGAMNRERGFKPPGILSLWKAWRNEQYLNAHYPTTD